ncbi:MAG: sugar-binding protein, partial [bacterium]|nr:sugar-binding protein [bacterium]
MKNKLVFASIILLSLPLFAGADVGIFPHQTAIGTDAQGSATFSNGTYTVKAKSGDIWGYNDSFYFVYKEMTGDFTIRVKADNVRGEGNETWIKTGVMVRDSLEVNAPYAMAWIRSAGDHNFRPGFRNTLGAHAAEQGDWINGQYHENPQMLGEMELSRIGSLFIWYYVDPNGNRILHSTRNMPSIQDPVYVGLSLCSNNTNGETTSTYTNLQLTELPVRTERHLGATFKRGFLPSEEVTVTLHFQNSGAEHPSQITETFPEGFTVLDAGGGSVSGQSITWNHTIPAGQSTLAYTLRAPADYLNPGIPREFRWHGFEHDVFIAGDTSASLIFAEPYGQFSWHGDIGDVETRGSVDFDPTTGMYRIDASGNDVWNEYDEFHYVFNQVSGSFRMKAKVTWIEGIHDWTMAGIMIRDNLSPGSPHATIRARHIGLDGQAAWRLSQDQVSSESPNGLIAGPWSANPRYEGELEIEKIGNTVNYYYYDLAGQRVLMHSLDVRQSLSDTVYVGLMSLSHIDGNPVLNEIEGVEFQALAMDATASRTLAGRYFASGESTEPITIDVSIRSGSPILTETVPLGWMIQSANANQGTVTVDGTQLVWNLQGITGDAQCTYTLLAPDTVKESIRIVGFMSDGTDQFAISGTDTLLIQGGNEAECPFIDRAITLDGILDPAEWEGAYTVEYDRENNLPPGHLIFGVLKPNAESNTKAYFFQDAEHIYLGLQVTDLDINPDLTNVWEADGVEVSWNGTFSRGDTFTADRENFQTIVTADGSRAIGQFVPTIQPLPTGEGYFSQDGQVWNFGGRINPDGQGYGTEYTLKKAEILNPLDIQKIGFSLSTNDAIASKIRESRYALWMINA